MTSGEVGDERFVQLVYRVPSDTSRARVAVWRELKRLGALYIQQAVCVLPDREGVRERLGKIRAKIDELGGESMLFVLEQVEELERAKLVAAFRENSAKEYAEIVEECETKFFKEIEFERYRENFTFEETEEIRQDLEKLRRWLRKIEGRDWMLAEGRDLAHAKVAECERQLEEFEADVYDRVGDPDRS